jgi:Holliday junction resolvase RusA-like endonuclease
LGLEPLAVVIELRVAGKAHAKQRQRFDPRSKRAYTPPANIVNENDIRAVWREAGEPRIEDQDAAVGIEMFIKVVRPKGHYKKDGTLSAEGKRNPKPANKKPDLDNALKTVMDALNSRAYRDDVRVARALVDRDWGEWPEITIKLYQFNGSNVPA